MEGGEGSFVYIVDVVSSNIHCWLILLMIVIPFRRCHLHVELFVMCKKR